VPDSGVSVSGNRVDNVQIWDAEGPTPAGDWTSVLWRGFSDGVTPNVVSIPQLIEENADSLRSRYLVWVYALGELRIKGRRLIDHLQLHPGFSYWWMTLLVEKCNYSKSPQIDDAIRVLAFTDWAAGRALERVTLVSANDPLAECLRVWCEKTGVAFEWRRLPRPVVPLSWARRAFAALPVVMQAWVWLLKYLLDRWPLRGAGLQAWRQTTGSVTFVSYLFNLVPDAAKAGQYESRYWGPLPEVLQREGCKTNWLHLYLKDALLPDVKKAAGFIRTLNENGRGMAVHATLDSFLSLSVVRQTFQDWLKLAWQGDRLHSLIATAPQTGIDLWPLFVEDWRESTCGVTAMSNALYCSLFDAALKALPKQQIGCYLQENQGWEFALIQHWKLAKQGRLVGVPHSSVRFWDLRYFFDPRNYCRNRIKSMPLPDQVAVNGQAATDAYLQGGYPADELVQVEALRYLYLGDANAQPVANAVARRQGLRLLVLGDYLASNTRLQMRLLAKAAVSLPAGMVITVKPHPACPIHAEDYPELRLTMMTEPLADLVAECDVVYASAVTSAAVDAYCAGVPVVSVLDPTTLNMSPLRGYAGTLYASTPDELIRALQAIRSSQLAAPIQATVFTLNRALPLWRRLLVGAS
jgi:surface carbohydrate biosynthesis protein (TIGR04326 family)